MCAFFSFNLLSHCTDYRSNTIRKKRWSPDLEQKIKHAFNVIKNEDEAIQYLMGLGLTAHEIDLVLQHFLNNSERNRKQPPFTKHQLRSDHPTMPTKNNGVNSKPNSTSLTNATYARMPLSSHEQQLELIGFSQNVSILSISDYLCGTMMIEHWTPYGTIRSLSVM